MRVSQCLHSGQPTVYHIPSSLGQDKLQNQPKLKGVAKLTPSFWGEDQQWPITRGMDTGERCSLEAIVITSLSFQIMLYHGHILVPISLLLYCEFLAAPSFIHLLFPFTTSDCEHCFVSAEFLMDDERSKRKVGKKQKNLKSLFVMVRWKRSQSV